VVLYGSPGPIAETHDFGGFLEILGSKMLVCIDSRHADNYAYHGLLEDLARRYNNVHKYTWPEDIRHCHLVTEIKSRLTCLRAGKWWAARSGRA
jgi:hypothetical protein